MVLSILAFMPGIVFFVASKLHPQLGRNTLHFKLGGMFSTSPPVFSSDKKRLAYSTTSIGRGAIVVHGLSSNDSVILRDDEHSFSSPRFLADGNKLIVVAEKPGVYSRIAIWNLESKQLRMLSPTEVEDQVVDVSTNGTVLVDRIEKELFSGGGRIKVVSEGSVENLTVIKKIGREAANCCLGIVFMPSGRRNEIWLRKTAGDERLLTNAQLERIGKNGQVLFYSRPTEDFSLDRVLYGLDLTTGETWKAGKGHSPVHVGGSTCLALEGYGEVINLTSDTAEQAKRIIMPRGLPELYEDPLTGAILFYDRISNGTNGVLYEYNRKTGGFEKLLDIP